MLEEGLVATGVEASSWQDAARAAGQLLVNSGAVEPAYVDRTIETVLKFGPYMIPVPDVAFFHGPPGEYVNTSSLAFITLRDPVFFSEFDNQRITAAFAFGAVDQSSHFDLLAKVVALLQDDEFLSLATGGGDKASLMRRIQSVLKDS